VVGFTIGIATVIALSQLGEVLGLHAKLGYDVWAKIHGVMQHLDEVNPYAIAIALATFAISKVLLKISPMIPAPLIGIGVGTLLATTAWSGKGLATIGDKFGQIPTNFLVFSGPAAIQWTPAFLGDLAFYVSAIVFVSAVESLLCSRMADRLANNQGLPYHPNKELWGQGLVQVVVPLLNGFPHTGALARTATNIKLGALSPLAGIFKCVLKLGIAAFLAHYLEMVPMACIGGILLYVASGMVKPAEVKEVLETNRAEVAVMAFTAVMVVATDFMKGVLSALVLYGILMAASRRKQEVVPLQEAA
jgi:SulP family sulfate permease